jgi:hypothetical protein
MLADNNRSAAPFSPRSVQPQSDISHRAGDAVISLGIRGPSQMLTRGQIERYFDQEPVSETHVVCNAQQMINCAF